MMSSFERGSGFWFKHIQNFSSLNAGFPPLTLSDMCKLQCWLFMNQKRRLRIIDLLFLKENNTKNFTDLIFAKIILVALLECVPCL